MSIFGKKTVYVDRPEDQYMRAIRYLMARFPVDGILPTGNDHACFWVRVHGMGRIAIIRLESFWDKTLEDHRIDLEAYGVIPPRGQSAESVRMSA